MTTSKLKWFMDAKFGMFIHWGLYALPGGLWKGREMEYIGEWLQARFRIPNAEYAELAKQFDPSLFDAEEWVLTAKAAGMRYIVYTAKHHEGFAMYRSRVSPFNVCDATPFKRDPLEELAMACAKHGLRLGLYYSQDLDWHEPDGGDPGPESPKNAGMMSWGNDWDFPDFKAKKFSRYFEGKVLPQLEELLTNYGRISTLWFDCPVSIGKADSERIVALVRRLQPECLVNTRIGNGLGDYGSLGDNQVPSARLSMASESPGTLNDTWGFKVNDDNWKSHDDVIELLAGLASKDANYLLNVGPRPDGRFPDEATAILKSVGKWMDEYGPAIYATRGNPFPYEFDWGFMTAGETADGSGRLNFLVKARQDGGIAIAGLKNGVKRCYEISKPNTALPYEVEDCGETKTLRMKLPAFDAGIRAFAAELDSKGWPEVDQRLIPQNGRLRLLPGAGRLRHGEGGASDAGIRGVGAAGEKQEASGHSFIDQSGKLVEWQNPSDSVSWELLFPKGGDFAVEFVTASRGHNAPWTDGQTVRIEYADQDGVRAWEATLSGRVVDAAGSRCYKEGVASAGSIAIRAGSQGVLSVSMASLGDSRNVNMALKELRLKSE